jgi:hypothetical protein
MSIFGFGRKWTLHPAWKFDSGGTIWRIHPTDSEHIVGEVRDLEKKKTTFFSIDCQSGDVRWEKRSFVDDWWVGLECVGDGKVFLHGFVVPDLPGHMKIIAADLATGKELWENSDLTFDHIESGKVIAYRGSTGSRTFFALHSSSGDVIDSWNETGQAEGSVRKETAPLFKDIIFPEMNRDFGDHPALLQLAKDRDPGSAFETLEVPPILVVSYCARRGDQEFRQELQVYNSRIDSFVYQDIQNDNTAGFTPDSFYAQNRMLYYVKERRNLIAVRLISSEERL